MNSTLFIILLAILTVIEFILDKTSLLDSIKQVVIDPIVTIISCVFTTYTIMSDPVGHLSDNFFEPYETGGSGLMNCLASTSNGTSSSFGFWIIMGIIIIVSVAISLFFLFIKTGFRFGVNTIPDMGVSNIIVSILEDAIVFVGAILAFFAQILALFFTLFIAGTSIIILWYFKRRTEEAEKIEIRNLCYIKEVG